MKLTFNSIKDIGGIKGPYLYRLHILNTKTGVWTTRVSQYATAPSYTFAKAGTYMVVVHASTVKSTTWKNYLKEDKTVANQKSTYGTYEAWKTIMVTINDSTVVSTISDGTDITSKFTDKYFKSYVYSLIGKTSPSPILYSDVKNIKYLNVNTGKDTHIVQDFTFEIFSLSGIQYFTALTELYCGGNKLTTLDVSKNTALTVLECMNNQLRTLNVSENTALTKLYCGGNKLTSLDVSKNTALAELYCDNNSLTTLEVSKNTALTLLYCDNNSLTTLDISKNTALNYLQCTNNKLTTLDTNIALIELNCKDNQLTNLDVSKSTALTKLVCVNNKLTTLDVSKNTVLTDLICNYNQLTSLLSIKDTWYTQWYRPQYTDSSHIAITESLGITIKN
ncbi:MAG: leucine-rich repeat domain-containing protein [Clostridium sp.]|uniref:leucine-rich repeat domain-containing protein n=1 Tax=Clostridium sp. TaxID=1506 RepID=UPI003D6CD762